MLSSIGRDSPVPYVSNNVTAPVVSFTHPVYISAPIIEGAELNPRPIHPVVFAVTLNSMIVPLMLHSKLKVPSGVVQANK